MEDFGTLFLEMMFYLCNRSGFFYNPSNFYLLRFFILTVDLGCDLNERRSIDTCQKEDNFINERDHA